MGKIVRYLARTAVSALPLSLLSAMALAQQPAPPRPAPQRPPIAAQAAPAQTIAPPVPAQQAQPAPAQQPQPQPSVQVPGNAPQRTTATYDDWIVQCETQAGPPLRKVCEMTQLTQIQIQGKAQPFSRAVVPRHTKDQPVSLIIQVPVNVSFSPPVRVQSSDTDQGLSAQFARCLPDGCFAEFEIKEDAMKKFRSATTPGKLSFSDSAGRPILIPVSFNGFGKAYDALLKE
jgi:invasion protein IalB